uniref:Uncharacterized protein n=1 Tax=Arundo donax TaxID=35708 RepID=A0A0A9CMM8_ARUDO
MHPVRGNPCTN